MMAVLTTSIAWLMVDGQLAAVGVNTASTDEIVTNKHQSVATTCSIHASPCITCAGDLNPMRGTLTTSCIVHEVGVCVEVDDHWLLGNGLQWHQGQPGGLWVSTCLPNSWQGKLNRFGSTKGSLHNTIA
jgi:hypothetical protein